jgi:hypothetical protein
MTDGLTFAGFVWLLLVFLREREREGCILVIPHGICPPWLGVGMFRTAFVIDYPPITSLIGED